MFFQFLLSYGSSEPTTRLQSPPTIILCKCPLVPSREAKSAKAKVQDDARTSANEVFWNRYVAPAIADYVLDKTLEEPDRDQVQETPAKATSLTAAKMKEADGSMEPPKPDNNSRPTPSEIMRGGGDLTSDLVRIADFEKETLKGLRKVRHDRAIQQTEQRLKELKDKQSKRRKEEEEARKKEVLEKFRTSRDDLKTATNPNLKASSAMSSILNRPSSTATPDKEKAKKLRWGSLLNPERTPDKESDRSSQASAKQVPEEVQPSPPALSV